ncbi:unnamed protein product [Clavelina lepadiformis]|uniref:TGF-beta family profile domain-containing protein n=1 Tax=Clavelina lepadiformis TaxID=159417 RepID=A0ABP0GHJ4_CLALP
MKLIALVLFVVDMTLTGAQISRVLHRSGGLMDNFSPSRSEEAFIVDCLKGAISDNDRRCHEMRAMARDMTVKDTSRHRTRRFCKVISKTGDLATLEKEYITKIVAMKNRDNSAKRDAMKMVASCSRFASSTRRKWKSFFDARTSSDDIEGKTFLPTRQETDGDVIEVVFNAPAFNASKYLNHDLVAVDLALLRVPPCQIDEYYGKYSLVVRKFSQQSQEFETAVHRSEQSSCPTLEGYMMVASLDRDELSPWFFKIENEQLKLQVQVAPFQQIFADENISELTNIVQRALSLTFHFRIGKNAQPAVVHSIEDLFPFHLEDLSTGRRNRRGLRKNIDNSECGRKDYHLDLRKPGLNIASQANYNVGECYGRCEYPLSSHMNATNHSIMMKREEIRNRQPPVPPTVDCVPLDYFNLHYLHVGDSNTVDDGILNDFIVSHCGCI